MRALPHERPQCPIGALNAMVRRTFDARHADATVRTGVVEGGVDPELRSGFRQCSARWIGYYRSDHPCLPRRAGLARVPRKKLLLWERADGEVAVADRQRDNARCRLISRWSFSEFLY